MANSRAKTPPIRQPLEPVSPSQRRVSNIGPPDGRASSPGVGASETPRALAATPTSFSSNPPENSAIHEQNADDASCDAPLLESELAEETQPQPSTHASATKRKRKTFSTHDLEELIRMTIERNPWGAKHSEKGKTWEGIRRSLQAAGMFEGVSVGTLRNKVDGMIKWHEDPDSGAGASMARELPTSTQVTLSALVDRAALQKHEAQNMTDAQKEKARKKDDEDRIGGESIRNAALEVFRKRKRDDDTSPAPTDVSDTENADPATPQKKKKRSHRAAKSGSSSLSALEREERDLDFNRRMLSIMERSEQRQEEMHRQTLDALREGQRASTEAYERATRGIIGILRDVFETERAREHH
ncbi:hypothetical protein PsYK624_079750 [Phanerochaete sordida]|uniref:Uncharacterized protein n=1 Tax=Phanerochaete sordida TaxID=48140 RepID=A0A9P3LEP7_9APHY|nr:hypothetical protein PsYK624_079750 [Phanerochaete sordida]